MDKNPVELVPVSDADIPLVRNVVDTVFTMSGLEIPARERVDLERIPASFRSSGGEIFSLSVKGGIAGVVAIRPTGVSAEMEIMWLSLVQGWRSMGMGRLMVERAIDFAREKGAKRIVVRLHSSCLEAISLFDSLRFSVVEDVDRASFEGYFHMRRVYA